MPTIQAFAKLIDDLPRPRSVSGTRRISGTSTLGVQSEVTPPCLPVFAASRHLGGRHRRLKSEHRADGLLG